MLSQLRVNHSPSNSAQVSMPVMDDRWGRNMQEDMKEAIDLTFKFKAALDKLHPECMAIIERMISLRPGSF